MKKKNNELTLFDINSVKYSLEDPYIIRQIENAMKIRDKQKRKKELRKLNDTLNKLFYTNFAL